MLTKNNFKRKPTKRRNLWKSPTTCKWGGGGEQRKTLITLQWRKRRHESGYRLLLIFSLWAMPEVFLLSALLNMLHSWIIICK